MPARPGMPEHGDIGDRLRRLEIGYQELLLARRLESATIGGGNLTFDGGQAVWIDSSGNVLFTIDENGLITFEADGSQLSVLDGSKLRFNRSDGTRILEITPAGGFKVYAANGTTERVVVDGDGVDVGGGLTVIDSSGVQVGTDVVIDSTGLHVDGGDVRALNAGTRVATAQNISLSTTWNNFATTAIAVPTWANFFNSTGTFTGQISGSAGNLQLAVTTTASTPSAADAQISTAAGETRMATASWERTFAGPAATITFYWWANVTVGTNSSNFFNAPLIWLVAR